MKVISLNLRQAVHTLEFKIERSIISMSKRGKMITCLILTLVMVVSCVPLFASALTLDIELPAGQAWTARYSAGTHQLGYDSASARCNSVYPVSGLDLFFQIQCRVVNNGGVVISQEPFVRLTEGAGDQKILLRQGMQGNDLVLFQFRGNSTQSARASVTYNATWFN